MEEQGRLGRRPRRSAASIRSASSSATSTAASLRFTETLGRGAWRVYTYGPEGC